MRAGFWLTIVLGLSACGGGDGDGDAARADAAADAAASREVISPAAPAEPDLPAPFDPVVFDCPSGWTERAPAEPDAATICVPFAEDAPPVCASGSIPIPGMASCLPVGASCPGGDGFPEIASPALYVRAGAMAGTGSRSAPFGSLADALVAAAPGATLVLAAGSYDPVALSTDVTLLGACAAEVEIAGAAAGAALSVSGGRVAVAGLTLMADPAGLALEGSGGELSLEGVVVAGGSRIAGGSARFEVATTSGMVEVQAGASLEAERTFMSNPGDVALRADAGTVTLRDSVVRGARVALELLEGASLTAERVAVMDVTGLGLSARGATVSLSDTVFSRIQDPESGLGAAITGAAGAELALRQVRVERVDVHAISVEGEATRVDFDRVVMRGVGAPEAAVQPRGLYLQGSRAFGRDVSIEEVFGTGVFLNGGVVHVERFSVLGVTRLTLLRGEPPAVEVEAGNGIFVNFHTHAFFDGLRVRDVDFAGITQGDPGSFLRLRDAVIRGVEPRSDGNFGRGLEVNNGAKAIFERLLIEETFKDGLLALRLGANVAGESLTIRGVRGRQPWLSGIAFGVRAAGDAQLDLRRVLVEDVDGVGVNLADRGRARLRDVRIRQMAYIDGPPIGGQTRLGRGVDVQRDSHLSAERLWVDEARDAGIVVSLDSSAEMSDVRVAFTADDGARGLGGNGVSVLDSTASLERLEVVDNREVGLETYRGTVEARDVRVLRTDLTRCTDDDCIRGGIGAGAYFGGAAMRLERFELGENALAGVQVGPDAAIDLSRGDVWGSPIGVNVASADYDLGRLTDEVRFFDNGVNLDSTVLPVPEPPAAIDLPEEEETP